MSKTTKPSWQDNDALLTYRVGPVLCCGPTLPIITITPPPSLTHLPGTNTAEPGIFKHGSHIVSATDLRYRFGVKQENWKQPGQVIIAQHGDLTRGYYVDEIKDVIHFPDTGWGQLPAYLPRGIFTRTLLLNKQIYLYTEFEKLSQLQGSGYLAEYISKLEEIKQIEETKTQSKNNQNITQPPEKNSDKPGAINPASNIQVTDTSKPYKPQAPIDSALPKSNIIESTATKTIATPENTSTNSIEEKKSVDITPKPENNKTESFSVTRLKQEKPTHISTGVKNKTTESKQDTVSSQRTTILPPTQITNKKETIQRTLKPAPASISNEIEQKSETKIASENIDPRTSVPNNQPEETTGSFLGLFIMFLILGIGSGGGYYYISHLTSAKNIATAPAPKEETYLSAQTPTTQSNNSSFIQAEATKPEIHASNITPPALPTSEPEHDDSNTHSSTSNLNQTLTTENSNREIKADEYHASIKQEHDTITIELDGPLPPAIKNIESSVAANDSPQELSNNSGDENTVTTDTLETNSSKSEPSEPISLKPGISKPESEKIQSTNPQKNKSVEIIHIIIKGDTLWAIAKHYLLNPFRYPELAKLSKIRNPDLIYPGNRVRIIYKKTANK